MVIWYKIFAWFGNLSPYLLGLLVYCILVPTALALRGPLGCLAQGGFGVFLGWVDRVADPEGYESSRFRSRYTPLSPKSFWLITLSLWGLGALATLAFWWIDQRY